MVLPNKLTLVRIFLVIPLITIFSVFIWYSTEIENGFANVTNNSKSQYFLYAAGVLFVLSMITDTFDGYLARKNNQITAFGKLFDPLADKIIITTTLMFLAIFGYTYLILVIVFIIRDLIVDGSRNLAALNKLKVEASIYGKLKTIFQSIAIPLLLFLIPTINKGIWWQLFLLNVPMILATIMSLFSGFDYFKQIWPIIKKDR